MNDPAASVESSGGTRTGFWVAPSSPNPFRPMTTIRFGLPSSVHVELAVYDVSGRRVAVLADRVLEPGDHEVTWRGTDARGEQVSPGIYLARLIVGEVVATQKIVRLD